MNQIELRKPPFWLRGLVPMMLLGVGLLHSVVGFASGRKVLAEIAHEGFWKTVQTGSTPITRPLLLWFLVSGFVLLMLGHLALWVERHARRPLPWVFGLELLLFAVVLGIITGGGAPAWLFAAGGIYTMLVASASKREAGGIA